MIVDIINKKRLGLELTYKELSFFFNGYLKGEYSLELWKRMERKNI